MTTKPGWRWDDDWRHRKLMDWLCTPLTERDPPRKSQLAELMGVDVRTLRGWHDNPQFREEWDRRVSKIIGDPDRAQHVIERLYRDSIDPTNRNRVASAKLYLEATHAIKPPPIEVSIKRPAELSDEELDSLLAAGAQSLRSESAAAEASESD